MEGWHLVFFIILVVLGFILVCLGLVRGCFANRLICLLSIGRHPLIQMAGNSMKAGGIEEGIFEGWLRQKLRQKT